MTHIEYRIKSSRVTNTFFSFLGFIICIPLFIKKSTFYQTVFFLICKMYTFDHYIWCKITYTYTTKQLIIFFTNQFCTFCVNYWCNDILLMHTTYRPSFFNVLLQLQDLINADLIRQSMRKRKAETVLSDTVGYYHRSKLCCLGICKYKKILLIINYNSYDY